MSGQNLYYDWATIARDAGLNVMVTDANAGWERRARSSGGFPAAPLGVMWHHAASSPSTTDEGCVRYQVSGNPDNPVGNLTLGRNGDVWPVAGGASNCSGKGGPMDFSRGRCELNNGNCQLVNIEVNNSGVANDGGWWSEKLISAYFTISNAINRELGNQPTDITSHALGGPPTLGYTDRKIDPARSDYVQGPWVPSSVNSSGTWSLADMRAEAQRRAGAGPTPPTPSGDDDMIDGIYMSTGNAQYVCYTGGAKFWITDDGMRNGVLELLEECGRSADIHTVEPGRFAAMGIVIGPRPEDADEWGNQ